MEGGFLTTGPPLLFFDHSSLVSAFPPFPDSNCLTLPFGTQEKVKEAEWSLFLTTRNGGYRKDSCQGGPMICTIGSYQLHLAFPSSSGCSPSLAGGSLLHLPSQQHGIFSLWLFSLSCFLDHMLFFLFWLWPSCFPLMTLVIIMGPYMDSEDNLSFSRSLILGLQNSACQVR